MAPIDPEKPTWRTVEVAPNEFISNEDQHGLFSSEADQNRAKTFFSYESKSDADLLSYVGSSPIENLTQPFSVMEFAISKKKYEHERRLYAFLTLIADFGGF